MAESESEYRVNIGNDYATINDIAVRVPFVRVRDLLGTGANGIVFSGMDNLGRKVAVKVWTKQAGHSRTVREIQKQAFVETHKVAELKHENLVAIHFAGCLENGWPYVVMEEAPGVPLKALPDRSSGSKRLRGAIVGQVLSGLAAAEKTGVLHGDLHEGNVIVDGVSIKVIDFGTSMFAGRAKSGSRHARLLRDFVYRTVPELKDWLVPVPQLRQLTGLQLLPVMQVAFTTFLMLQHRSDSAIRISDVMQLDMGSWPPNPIVVGAFAAQIRYFDLGFLFRRLEEIYSSDELGELRATMSTMLRIDEKL